MHDRFLWGRAPTLYTARAGSKAMTQTQAQTQIPKHVAEFLREELGLSLKQVRKCVDRDFVDLFIEILLDDPDYYQHRIYQLADGWFIYHVWNAAGYDRAVIAKLDLESEELEECLVIEEE